uniref:Uncharacterized protein n=1 Tax=Trypanosoma vivax (strain Y486) TaxID=1055687 RepID=G0UDB9_TRYVY|nr:conserved hypothetical protein [Trypanosoma vivax Y486]
MSSHFSGGKDGVYRTSLAYFLSPNRPRSVCEQRFLRHAKFRAVALVGFIAYFVYCNPEYSYTYSYLQKEYGIGTGKQLLPKLLELQKRPTDV